MNIITTGENNTNTGEDNITINQQNKGTGDNIIVQEEVGKIKNLSDYLLKTKYEGFEKIILKLDGVEKEIFFEEQNFRVNSDSWEIIDIDKGLYKVNPERDIIEFIIGDLEGEQLFTNKAKKRELEKHGGRLPTVEEFEAVVEQKGVENITKVSPGFKFDHPGDTFFSNQGFCSAYLAEPKIKEQKSPDGTIKEILRQVFYILHHSGNSYKSFDDRGYYFSIRRIID